VSHPGHSASIEKPPAVDTGSAREDLMTLTKARLSALVVATTAAGYALGVRGPAPWDGWTFAHLIFGTTLCACGSAVFNQLIEIDADARMHRTADRPLPARRIPAAAAFALGMVACGWGIVHLANKINVEAAACAAATLVTYLFIYTPMKQRSSLNTLVGSVSGAIPPLIGWAAIAGPPATALGFRWEWLVRPQALWLFALLFFWQLPHFLAINWMYRDEYRRAGFVMWSNNDDSGAKTASLSLAFSLCLLPVAVAPAACAFASWPALAGGVALTLWLVWLAWRFFRLRTRAAARKLFLATLAFLPLALLLPLVFAR
jgi:protoheme IX farnesyltransferase